MNSKQINLTLLRPAETAWSRVRAIVVLIAASFGVLLFSTPASAAVLAPERVCGESRSPNDGVLVSWIDVLAEVADRLECTAPFGLIDRAGLVDNLAAGGGMAPGASSDALPSDTPRDATDRIQHLEHGLLPVQSSSSSSTTGSGGTSPGGGTFALALASPALSAADCMISRLVLADQLFPPSPPLCGIFRPPRVF